MKKDHTKSIIDTSLEQAKMWGNAEYMEDGLVLTDRIADAPIPSDPTRLNFILMALCKRGRAQYSIDTREQTVNPGDLLFISERHIIDNYMASPDFECMCIMLSTNFYHGFIQNVKNVSSLLIFSTNNPVVPLTPMEIQTFSNYFQTIREKMTDKYHHFRKELVNALLLAMFYDMSNVIWRVEQKDTQSYTRAEFPYGTTCEMVCRAAVHHAQIPRRGGQGGQPAHPQRMDRQIRHTGSARAAEKLHQKHQGDYRRVVFPQPVILWQILQGTCRCQSF